MTAQSEPRPPTIYERAARIRDAEGIEAAADWLRFEMSVAVVEELYKLQNAHEAGLGRLDAMLVDEIIRHEERADQVLHRRAW